MRVLLFTKAKRTGDTRTIDMFSGEAGGPGTHKTRVRAHTTKDGVFVPEHMRSVAGGKEEPVQQTQKTEASHRVNIPENVKRKLRAMLSPIHEFAKELQSARQTDGQVGSGGSRYAGEYLTSGRGMEAAKSAALARETLEKVLASIPDETLREAARRFVRREGTDFTVFVLSPGEQAWVDEHKARAAVAPKPVIADKTVSSPSKELVINPLWVAYNNLHNEGGDGYNPHEKHVNASAEPLWAKLEGKRGKIMRIMNGTSSISPRYAELEKELAEVEAALKIAIERGV